MKNLRKNNNAITLIALVITIIILLILAGVTISTLTENGLFEKTKQAKIEHEKAQIKEELELAIFSIQSSNLNKMDISVIIKELPKEKNLDLTKLEWNSNQTYEEPLGVYKGYDFYVSKNYEVIIGKKENSGQEYIYMDFTMPNLTSNDCTINGKNYMVSANSELDSVNQPAYTAFDGVTTDNKSTGSWHAVAGVPQWIEVKLPYKVQINMFTIKNRYVEAAFESYTVKDFELQGSNDGYTWTTLGSYINQQGALNETTFSVQNPGEYYYYRWNCTSSFDNYITIGEIILNDAKIKKKKPSTIVKEIEQIGEVTIDSYSKLNDIVMYYDLLDDEEKNLITNFDKLQEAVNKYNNISVKESFIMPDLTSNESTIDGKMYKVSASTVNSSTQAPYMVFDGIKTGNRDSGCWHATAGVPQWVKIQFPNKVQLEKFTIKNRETDLQYEAYTVNEFELQGSNDGETWLILGSYTNQKGSLNETTFEVQNPEEYYYYRWYATTSYDSYISIGEIILDEAYTSYKPIITLNK